MRKPLSFAAVFALLLAAGSSCALRGAGNIRCNPAILYANAGTTELALTTSLSNPKVIVRWNGNERTITSQGGGQFTVRLDPADSAKPGLAEITISDRDTGLQLAYAFLPIMYHVRVGDAVFDRRRNRFYLTTPVAAEDKRFPVDSLVALDPDTGAPGVYASVGSEPISLALSDDGSALFVALGSGGVVRRLNPEDLSAVSEFRFRPATQDGILGWKRAAIALAPGGSRTMAVYCHPNVASSMTTLAVYDDGVLRGKPVEIYDDSYDQLLFSPDGKYLFLGNSATYAGSSHVLRYQVDLSGISSQTVSSVAGGGPVTVRDGILYTSAGAMIDIQNMDTVNILGSGGSLAVDPVNKRILTVEFENLRIHACPQYLQAFDLDTQQTLGRLSLDTPYSLDHDSLAVVRLLRFGNDGVLCASSAGLWVFHTPLAAPPPSTEARAVVNAASQRGGSVVPGEIVSIYGTNLGPLVPHVGVPDANGKYAAELGHVQVWFNRAPATPIMSYAGQLNVVAPFGLEPGSTVNMQVWYYGIPSARIPVTVAPAAPALFTRDSSGSGLVAVVNQDGTVNAPSRTGSIVALWGTGGGALPDAADGTLARGIQTLVGEVRASIGGKDAQVLYAGAAPGLVHGAFQINIKVPDDLAPGVVPVVVSVNGHLSPEGVTLEVR